LVIQFLQNQEDVRELEERKKKTKALIEDMEADFAWLGQVKNAVSNPRKKKQKSKNAEEGQPDNDSMDDGTDPLLESNQSSKASQKMELV
jgi:hypothetical protein